MAARVQARQHPALVDREVQGENPRSALDRRRRQERLAATEPGDPLADLGDLGPQFAHLSA